MENEEEQVLRSLKDAKANLQKKYEETESQILKLEAKCAGPAQDILQVRLCAGRQERRQVIPMAGGYL